MLKNYSEVPTEKLSWRWSVTKTLQPAAPRLTSDVWKPVKNIFFGKINLDLWFFSLNLLKKNKALRSQEHSLKWLYVTSCGFGVIYMIFVAYVEHLSFLHDPKGLLFGKKRQSQLKMHLAEKENILTRRAWNDYDIFSRYQST